MQIKNQFTDFSVKKQLFIESALIEEFFGKLKRFSKFSNGSIRLPLKKCLKKAF